MAFVRTVHPTAVDTGGGRTASYCTASGGDHTASYCVASGGDRAAPYCPAAGGGDRAAYPRKHRPRPFAPADPPAKRRRPDAGHWHGGGGGDAPSTSSAPPVARPGEEEDPAAFMSRDQIERLSPSRKDGINSFVEAQLRYSYCAYLQSLGARLQMPQTSIGTAMVLCHRFFVRRSHACHDRFLIATAALFLASKSEETPCLLNTVLRTSCEVCQAENLAFHPYLFSSDWFEQYRDRVTEAEQMILTTLDFELDVHHPYIPLTSVLNKFGLSQTTLFNLAWNFVTEGLRTSLWLQFKPNQIAAGAVFLAAKFLNFDLAFYPNIWHEFHTTPWVLQEVVQQLMEIF